MIQQPTIIAIDFDGVICDGMIEYFQTAWRTYCDIWLPTNPTPSEALAQQFYRTRPVIETGWEMPILVRALTLEIPENHILKDWNTICQKLVKEEDLKPEIIGPLLDRVRDQWIQTDFDGWLKLHRFYPGVIEQLKQWLNPSSQPLIQPIIITTKEERFVRALLQQQNIIMPDGTIYGKGCKRPKYETLRQLLSTPETPPIIWFIEDRLKALLATEKQPDLTEIRLFLADWGYNTQQEKEFTTSHPRIKLLTLPQFTQDFSTWLS
jgi:phosphoglycolate phosphatase-like HAD superfamily hydrolase